MAAKYRYRVLARGSEGYSNCMTIPTKTTVHIEHPINDFATWKAAFERAAPLRAASRVRGYEVHRPVDDPAYVMIRLDFDNPDDATEFLEKLKQLWKNRDATPALRGTPQVRILERMETSA
jgi:nucleotide-binding universal stress UspA family protein